MAKRALLCSIIAFIYSICGYCNTTARKMQAFFAEIFGFREKRRPIYARSPSFLHCLAIAVVVIFVVELIILLIGLIIGLVRLIRLIALAVGVSVVGVIVIRHVDIPPFCMLIFPQYHDIIRGADKIIFKKFYFLS